MTDNIAAYMEQVARHYWGEPTRKTSTTLRWGNKGGREANLRKGVWFDYEINEGGGVVDLVKHFEGAQLGGISKILERKFGISKPQIEHLAPREWLSKVYDYVDEHGEVRYQVLRYEPTRYVQRRPDGDKYIYKMDGVEPLPYNLPGILAAPDATVFVVEGEKCADALIRLGLVATTSHGGAGKWREPLNQWFAGRRVIVLPDNDAPGARHADGVIAQLFPVAKEIRRVNLPGLAEKGDVFDWLNSGGDLKSLREICKNAPVVDAASVQNSGAADESPCPIYEEIDAAAPDGPAGGPDAAAGQALFPILTMDQLLAMPPVEWLIDGLIPRDGLATLYGPPGAGKSFAALDMAASVAAGRPWHGKPVEGGPVLYIAGEGVGGLNSRLKALRAARGWYERLPLYTLPQAVDFPSQASVERLLATVNAIGAPRFALVIVDTVARMMAGADENDASVMSGFVAACDAIKRACGGALLALHHSNKGRGDMRGSSALLGGVDTSIKAAQAYGPTLELTVEKQKDGDASEPLRFRMRSAAIIGGASVVLERVADAPQGKPLPPAQYLALQALQNILIDTKQRRVAVAAWAAAHAAKCPDEARQKRNAARAALQTAGRVVIEGGEVWLAPSD